MGRPEPAMARGLALATLVVVCGSAVVTSRPPVASPASAGAPPPRAARLGEFDLDVLAPYESLRGPFDRDRVQGFFKERPLVIARRLGVVAKTFLKTREAWDAEEGVPEAERTRGETLRTAIASLGPVSVKVGQTLSQRPDLVGEEACEALKALQTRNAPFSDEAAMRCLADEFGLEDVGLLAPGVAPDAGRPFLKTEEYVFAALSKEPVAVASLGQVYKGRTHDGVDVAVKIQRPDALRTCAVDYTCFAVVWAAIQRWWTWKRGSEFDNGDIGEVVDTVADGIFDELNYGLEAVNAKEFKESLDFLGFVDVPRFLPELSTDRVLTTEWIRGNHLEALGLRDGALMTQLAVEACTASLVLTGFVHADPHEGNIMLQDDGKVVFLDFGLMSRVDGEIMESFATGIRACLAEDYGTLAQVFSKVGFLTTPLEFREDPSVPYVNVENDVGLLKFETELREAMAATEGGTSRFGALAEVLNGKLSKRWKMFTPPYCLLLIRTFLTLEGIAAQVDPDFNIYSMSLPWALRRSLAPTSPQGVKTLRSSLLQDDNRVKWDALLDLMDSDEKPAASEHKKKAADEAAIQPETDLSEALTAVVGSSGGAALRKAFKDVDAADLASKLTSPSARPLRRKAALELCGAIDRTLMPSLRAPRHAAADLSKHEAIDDDTPISLNGARGAQIVRATSDTSRRMRARQKKWQRKVTRFLLSYHLRTQVSSGWRGALTIAKLAFLALRVCAGAVRQFAQLQLSRIGRKLTGAGAA